MLLLYFHSGRPIVIEKRYIAKFKVDGIKNETSSIASVPAKSGDVVWLITYGGKNTKPIPATVKSVETFMDKYSYYIFTLQVPDNSVACPCGRSAGIGLFSRSIVLECPAGIDFQCFLQADQGFPQIFGL